MLAREQRVRRPACASHEASEEELKSTLWLLNNIIDSLPFILFVKDAKELRLKVVNKTFADVLQDHQGVPAREAGSRLLPQGAGRRLRDH